MLASVTIFVNIIVKIHKIHCTFALISKQSVFVYDFHFITIFKILFNFRILKISKYIFLNLFSTLESKLSIIEDTE